MKTRRAVTQPAVRRRPSRAFTIIDAIADPEIFGALPAFRDLSTWRAWLVFLRAAYGLPLEGDDLEIFRRHTGRATYAPPPGGFPEVVCMVGRQSGKTRVAATVAAFEAVLAERDETYAVLVAQDHRAALRTLFGYARAPFETVPVLQCSVSEIRADTVRLRSGVTWRRTRAGQRRCGGYVPRWRSSMSWRSSPRPTEARPIPRCCARSAPRWPRRAASS